MYLKNEPKKVGDDLLELVASALGMDYETHKPQVLAVAVAKRYKHESSDSFNDNPTKINIVESTPPISKVELVYKHPFGKGDQRYRYVVNTEKGEGHFIDEGYSSLR